MECFVDTLPNLLRMGTINAEEATHMIRGLLEPRLAQVANRLRSLPPLLVKLGPHLDYLREARELYLLDYFVACIALCGITAERILKDILARSLFVERGGKPSRINEEAQERLERADVSVLVKFACSAGLLTKETRQQFLDLGELRNLYAHARRDNPEADALTAIKHLHEIIKGTSLIPPLPVSAPVLAVPFKPPRDKA